MVNEKLETSDIENLINNYKKKLEDQLHINPGNLLLEGKLSAAHEISHRILILSRGGLRIIE